MGSEERGGRRAFKWYGWERRLIRMQHLLRGKMDGEARAMFLFEALSAKAAWYGLKVKLLIGKLTSHANGPLSIRRGRLIPVNYGLIELVYE